MKNNSTILLTILLLFAIANISFAQLVTSGSETLANSTATNDQQHPKVAMDASGNFVIVWESWGTDGDGYGIYFQRYNSAGTAQGSETKANFTTSNDQRMPDVAMDEDGDFVIVWQSDGQDGDNWGIYFQRYNSSGVAQGSQTRANTTLTGRQAMPKVAMAHDGSFGITWEDEGDITLRLYNSSGFASTSEITANSTTANTQNYPSIAMDASGNLVVVWQSYNLDGDGFGIYSQRFNSSGTEQGGETIVNTTTAGHQESPDVAMDEDGDFVVIWTDESKDGSNDGIYAQRFNAAGTAQGAETSVNSTTSGSQDNVSVDMNLDGFFVVSWNSYGQDGAYEGVYHQSFSPDGTTQGSETIVNSTTGLFQQFPSVSIWDDGNALIVWQDGLEGSGSSKDGNGFGIAFQMYSAAALPVELLFFHAYPIGEKAQLKWVTATEINADRFEVEHSTDGFSFRKIGEVKATGTTNHEQHYGLLHELPAKGINYYRLKQFDFGGSFEYSHIETVVFGDLNDHSIAVYPIPASSDLYIELPKDGDFSIELFDEAGRMWWSGDNLNYLDVSQLMVGSYFLKIKENVSQKTEVKKVFIVR